MIGIDTNVLVRYLVQDDKRQSQLATKLIEESLSTNQPGYITLITLVEVVWVLKSCYSVNKSELPTGLRTERSFENPPTLGNQLPLAAETGAGAMDARPGADRCAARREARP